jgi:hypothetical protein
MSTCIGCNGRLGWYDEETGIFVACLSCQEGRDRHEYEERVRKRAKDICDRKLAELRKELGG